ncbi:30S ribosomal protein S17 [Spirochaeta africana]|uniref:Small ribosomal subunit protein uS17 n=1 Tax=Spirochaeta africana (strain ATCC 700263 / DSM 8902 / Z-7692) TaxID=889378 RepID=H9UGM1_SPIAZ|nr:30S ribosomal protein S17 [Spirochaeta africana]AFG36664.1 30S ribosomal protein S17 [Spirochaeta africana DSM 8902]
MDVQNKINTVGKKVYTGQVVSDKMDKTIVVLVETKTLHPLYKKYVNTSKRVKAHDETNQAGVGDTVRVIEARKVSKHKAWRLLEIVERAK